jgi:hypothetical protein
MHVTPLKYLSTTGGGTLYRLALSSTKEVERGFRETDVDILKGCSKFG